MSLKATHLPVFALLVIPGVFSLAGCASSPSGASVQAPNRLGVTLNLANTLDTNGYYAVAFDDIVSDGQGPVAILGNTPVLNGVVGGSWRVAVVWNAGQFHVYRRSTPSDASTEREILVSPFIGTPRASASSVTFTLDLDAKFDAAGTYFFPHTASGSLQASDFEINFVTTNTVLKGDPSIVVVKPVDAYQAAETATYFQFQVDSTRTVPISDPTGDRNLGSTTAYPSYNFGQIDVNQLTLAVTRG